MKVDHITAAQPSSATVPLLPLSHNPSISNPSDVSLLTIPSQCAKFLVLLHRILLFALGFFTLLCVVMATSPATKSPKFQLDSLFVSKLNVDSNTMLGASFDATFTIENPNLVSWLRFNRLDGSISYKDNVIATYSLDPFVLGLKEERTIRVTIAMAGLQDVDHDEDQTVVKEWVLDEIMSRQREDGAVNLSMEMFARATYRTGWWATQSVIMNPQCSNLKVGFLPEVGFGSWIHEGSMMCSVPMLID